jgi:lysophospholipid acyltransferase (LPLAT)-like uncharacterized protein
MLHKDSSDQQDKEKTLVPAVLPWFLKIAVFMLVFYIRLVWVSGFWKIVRPAETQKIIDRNLPYIGIFWHGRLLMMPKAKPWVQRFYMLTSYNRAGSFTSALIKPFNIDHVRGSSGDPRKPEKEKGGSGALRKMTALLKKDISVGITPDGSRGPRMRLSMGVIILARLSGKPIVPLTFSSRHAVVLKGWDRLMIPLPFMRGAIYAGEPLYVPKDTPAEKLEEYRLKVEEALNALQLSLDEEMGVPLITPAPLISEHDK